MQCKDDLSLLERVFTLFRIDIDSHLVPLVCTTLADTLDTQMATQRVRSGIRPALAKAMGHVRLDDEEKLKWAFIFSENDGGIDIFPPVASMIFYNIFSRIKELVHNGSMEQAYDFVDCIHCLPDIIRRYNYIPKDYIRTYICPYSKKWKDKMILKQIERYNSQIIPKV